MQQRRKFGEPGPISEGKDPAYVHPGAFFAQQRKKAAIINATPTAELPHPPPGSCNNK